MGDFAGICPKCNLAAADCFWSFSPRRLVYVLWGGMGVNMKSGGHGRAATVAGLLARLAFAAVDHGVDGAGVFLGLGELFGGGVAVVGPEQKQCRVDVHRPGRDCDD